VKNLVIIGAGGFAREIAFLVAEINRVTPTWNVLGHLDLSGASIGNKIGAHWVIGTDSYLENCSTDVHAVVAIGVPSTIRRVVEGTRRVPFPNLIHPGVVMDRERVSFGEGNVVFPGVTLTTDINFGSFNILNAGCTVGHDAKIGDYNVISPGVHLCGGAVIGDGCLLGSGACVLPNKRIADSAVVGAGFIVAQDVNPGLTIERLLWAKRLLSEDPSKPLHSAEMSSRAKER